MKLKSKTMEANENTKIAVLQEQMKAMGTNVALIMQTLRDINDKLDDAYVKKEEFLSVRNDHETRIRKVELWGGMAIGGLSLIQVYLNFIK